MVESKQPTLLTTAQLIPPGALLALICPHLALKVLMDPSTYQLLPIASTFVGTPWTTPVGWLQMLCWGRAKGLVLLRAKQMCPAGGLQPASLCSGTWGQKGLGGLGSVWSGSHYPKYPPSWFTLCPTELLCNDLSVCTIPFTPENSSRDCFPFCLSSKERRNLIPPHCGSLYHSCLSPSIPTAFPPCPPCLGHECPCISQPPDI